MTVKNNSKEDRLSGVRTADIRHRLVPATIFLITVGGRSPWHNRMAEEDKKSRNKREKDSRKRAKCLNKKQAT